MSLHLLSPHRRCAWFALGALLCFLITACGQAFAAPSPCLPRTFEGSNYIICTIDLRAFSLRLFWKDEKGQPYGGFERLPHSLNGAPMAFAMNAGMYDPDLSPIGLYIEDGKTLKRANTANGPGNFHLKPNGIFYFRAEDAGILITERFLSQKPAAEFATQSGPMLVINGKIHPKIHPGDNSRKFRNGVGLRDAHTVVFAISEDQVTFWEFARLFRDALGSANALFLDGSISSLYAPALHRSDSLYPMGPIIAAFQRK